jgi:hypothetical protein
MIFLKFGKELISLSQVYQIDLKDADGGVLIAFFYHLAGSTSGGYKVSRTFRNTGEALNALVSLGINIRPVEVDTDDQFYHADQVPTGRVNTRLEPRRKR